MTQIRSLRVRFVIAFALFGGLLTFLCGALAWELVHVAEDLVVERWLAREAAHVQTQRANDAGSLLPSGPVVFATTRGEKLPPIVREKAQSLPHGAHEIDRAGEAQWRLWIGELPDGQRLYLWVDEAALEGSESVEGPAIFLVVGMTLVMAMVGMILGMLTSRRVIDPLLRLSEAVSRHHPEDPPPRLQHLVADDELGVLAGRLEAAMDRVATTARQEQLFGRYTSHELRSSLAVASGVAELLGDWEDPRIQRTVARLHRAIQDMEEVIETCLWLARSQMQVPPSEHIPLRPLVDELVQRMRSRASPEVRLVVEIGEDAVVLAPAQGLRMILGNLLSNALRHTASGHILLEGDADGVSVQDSGPGIPQDILTRVTEPHVHGPGGGHGLGLAIVNGLCGRLGWTFSVSSSVDEGTRARVQFDGGRSASGRAPGQPAAADSAQAG